MSATQTIHLVDQLVKASIPKQTATELVEYVESQNGAAVNKELSEKVDKLQSKIDADVGRLQTDVVTLKTDVATLKSSVSWIKWIMGAGFTLVFSAIFYLHNNTQENMQAMETRIMRAIEAIGARK